MVRKIKAVKAGKDWSLTVPAKDCTLEELKEKLAPYRWVGQKERGKQSTDNNVEGYVHYQVAIINDTSVRFETLQHKFPTTWILPRWGTRQELFDYCSKDDTREDGPWTGGDWTNREKILAVGTAQGKRSDLDTIRESIMEDGASFEELITNPDLSGSLAHSMAWAKELIGVRDASTYGAQRTQRFTKWIWGPAGSGKTTMVEATYGFENTFEVTSYEHPFDGYAGQPVIFLDEFYGQLPFHYLLKLMDDSPVKLPARYQDSWAKHSRLIIASNRSPREVYKDIGGEERIAFYRRLDFIIEPCPNHADRTNMYQPKEYFLYEKQHSSSNRFGAFLGCYDPDHFDIDYKVFEQTGEDFPFPLRDLRGSGELKIDYDSGSSPDLPYKRSEDEDLDFDVF